MSDETRINSTAMTMEDHATRACNLMGVAGLVRTDMWASLVAVSQSMDNAISFKDTMRNYEEKWCKENITDGSLKTTKSGKPVVGPHLESTYKQYKSRIITAMKKGVSLLNTDNTPKPPSQVQKELTKSSSKTATRAVGTPVTIPVTFSSGGKEYAINVPAIVDLTTCTLSIPTFEGAFHEK